jgi:hypothetical protein
LIRLLSLLLFGLLLYNMVGYSVAYLLEEHQTLAVAPAGLIERSLYSDDIMIKMPVSLPYQVSWEHAEDIDGNILHEGKHYRMRSRQMINDTMYVHCEYDQNARDRFANLVSRIQDQIATNHHPKKSASTLLKHFLKEFLAGGRKQVFYLLEWVPAHLLPADQYHFAARSHTGNIPSPPPDQV